MRLETVDYSDPDYVFFVTLCARHLASPFLEPRLASLVVDALLYQRQSGQLKIYAFVLMPDHLHAAVSLGRQGRAMPEVVRDFKSYTTQQAWRHGVGGQLWQRSYYDHIARYEESLVAICEYIIANPVRKGLTDEVGQWPYAGSPDQLPIG